MPASTDGGKAHHSLSRFDINGNALSLPVSVGISGIQTYVGTPKTLQEGLYQRSIQALDNAKLKGNQVEVIQES